jgi:ankyrin repeat protein
MSTNNDFFKAATSNDLDKLKLLIAGGADIHAKDKYGQTALHEASRYGYTEALKLLIAGGADIHAKDQDCRTALHEASRNGHTEVLKLLIAGGADVNAKDQYGLTALHEASWNGHTECTEILMSKQKDEHLDNTKDEKGCATHYQKKVFTIEVAETLYPLTSDQDVEQVDKLTKLGFKFAYSSICQKSGKKYPKLLVDDEITVSLEINSLEELMTFAKDFGRIIIDGDLITIYNGPME